MAGYFWQRGDTRLRPLRESDAKAYLDADLDSAAKRLLNFGVGLPRDLETQGPHFHVAFRNAPKRLDFAVEDAGETFVGFVAISDIDEQHGSFSTVTFILAAHRRLGHGARAKEMLLDYMFNERRFEKYNTACLATNAAIIAHLRKLGCAEEGRRRQNVYFAGQRHDELLFGLTRSEFASRRS